jgi:TolB-like protein
MPFSNESGNNDIEYLSDGMTDSLINSLSQLPICQLKREVLCFVTKEKRLIPSELARIVCAGSTEWPSSKA